VTFDDLLAAAASMGLHVKFTNLGRRAGEVRRSGLVLINERKSAIAQKVALAHEMGHWHHKHDWSAAHDVPHDERQADAYAAHLLISPAEYVLAEQLYDGHAGAIARELDVTAPIVHAWRDLLRRVPPVAYSTPWGYAPTSTVRKRDIA
jgi:Zn-dependent peptidase ImmA (M78 family)